MGTIGPYVLFGFVGRSQASNQPHLLNICSGLGATRKRRKYKPKNGLNKYINGNNVYKLLYILYNTILHTIIIVKVPIIT